MSVFVIEDSSSDSDDDGGVSESATNTTTTTPTHSTQQQQDEEEKSGLLSMAANRSVGTFAFIGALVLGCCCCCNKEYRAAAVESYDRHTVFGWFCPIVVVDVAAKKPAKT